MSSKIVIDLTSDVVSSSENTTYTCADNVATENTTNVVHYDMSILAPTKESMSHVCDLTNDSFEMNDERIFENNKKEKTHTLEPWHVEDEDGHMEILSHLTTALKNVNNISKLDIRLSAQVIHFAQMNDRDSDNWSCGYRNIQMLTSAILCKHGTYASRLFGGHGFVPTIYAIQRWIERAWHLGFDPDGASQLGHTLYGTTKWIGATECAILLRSFGIPAVLLDIHATNDPLYDELCTLQTQPNYTVLNHIKLLSMRQISEKLNMPCKSRRSWLNTHHNAFALWLQHYFNGVLLFDNTSSVRRSPTGTENHNISNSGMYPLYFQHAGHSRTIVGYQTETDTEISRPNNFVSKYFMPLADKHGENCSASTSAGYETNASKCTSEAPVADRHRISAGRMDLFVFDPAYSSKLILNALTSSKPSRASGGSSSTWKRLLKRGITSLKHKQYQVVFVPPEEFELSETIMQEFTSPNLIPMKLFW